VTLEGNLKRDTEALTRKEQAYSIAEGEIKKLMKDLEEAITEKQAA
jgi:hypothetical protein